LINGLGDGADRGGVQLVPGDRRPPRPPTRREELDRLAGKARTPSDRGGVDHIGFAVDSPATLDLLVRRVQEYGGTLLWRTDNERGGASAFVTDHDGYVLHGEPKGSPIYRASIARSCSTRRRSGATVLPV